MDSKALSKYQNLYKPTTYTQYNSAVCHRQEEQSQLLSYQLQNKTAQQKNDLEKDIKNDVPPVSCCEKTMSSCHVINSQN